MLVEKAYADYTDFRIPGIVATKKGALLRYCECRKAVSDWADIDIKIVRSEDHGRTWTAVLLIESGGNTLNNPVMLPDVLKNPSECALAVTEENEVLISIRHEGEIKRRGLAKSPTGFSDWKNFHFEENLPDPVCMGSMTYKNGRIYHSNCDSAAGRKNLTIKISDDCFCTHKSIHVSNVGGYSDIALLGNKLCIVYEKTIPTRKKERPFEPFELFFEIFETE